VSAPGAATLEHRRARPDAAGIAERLEGWYPAAVAVGAFAFTVVVASSDGGYFPTAWNWATMMFAWVITLALVLRERIMLGRLELATVAALSLFVAFVGLSIAWSDDRPQSVLELQRGLLYVAALVAILLAVRRRTVTPVLGGVLAGIALICVYALATRLFPVRGEELDVITQNRLAEPLGYWNALGVFGAMGALLALGFAARAETLPVRAASAAALPLILATVYFTYSRGSWIAFGLGLAAALALDRRRVQLALTVLLLAPLSAAAVWISSRSEGLTQLEAPYQVIADDGRQLAVVLVALAAASGVVGLALGIAEDRLRVPRPVQRGFGAVLLVALVGLLVGVFVRFGSPPELVEEAYDSFRDEPTEEATATDPGTDDLNQRLFTLRSNGRLESWEASLDSNRDASLAGAGAGTFEQYWLQNRTIASQIRDAHSLYFETLAELGFLGLGLLVAALAIPVLPALGGRSGQLGAAVVGAYVVFVAHAGVDWDWEMPAVTLTGLVLAAALLIGGSRAVSAPRLTPEWVRVLGVGAAVALAGLSVLGLLGNRAIASATDAVQEGRFADADEDARDAIRWAPWSPEGWHQLGNAQLALGYPEEARLNLLEATGKAPGDWRLWYDLGTASRGSERERAYRRAAELNPLGRDIEVLREEKRYDLPPAPEVTR
jgi:hypothetical protein